METLKQTLCSAPTEGHRAGGRDFRAQSERQGQGQGGWLPQGQASEGLDMTPGAVGGVGGGAPSLRLRGAGSRQQVVPVLSQVRRKH